MSDAITFRTFDLGQTIPPAPTPAPLPRTEQPIRGTCAEGPAASPLRETLAVGDGANGRRAADAPVPPVGYVAAASSGTVPAHAAASAPSPAHAAASAPAPAPAHAAASAEAPTGAPVAMPSPAYASSADVARSRPGGQCALSVKQLTKVYGRKESVTKALDGVSFSVEDGEFVGIMGASGSGKSTLLNCIATIDKPTSGQVLVGGKEVSAMSNRALAKFRRDDLGFIFQDSNLLNTLTGFENIALALTIKHDSPRTIPDRVHMMASTLGVAEVLKKYPYQMSGGQRQRIAAARAMVADPRLVLADEPTGALDSRSAAVMLEVMEMMNTQLNATILMVTHDAFAASFTQRILFLQNGRIFSELHRGSDTREQFFARILEVVAFLGGEANHAG